MQYQYYIGNFDIIIKTLQGHHIDSVGWNWQNANDATTGAILLGTSKGKNLFQLKTTMYSTTKNGTRLLYPYNTLQLLLIRTLYFHLLIVILLLKQHRQVVSTVSSV